jgi:predicted nucleic acid-binding protein
VKSKKSQAAKKPQPKTISNAGPLIHLAKTNALHILKNLYQTILIPTQVQTETVQKGKQKGAPDAILIEEAINQGWIKTIKIQPNPEFQKAAQIAGLHPAEATVIQHAYQNNLIALLDDEPARIFAKTLGIKTHGTIGVLIQAHKKHIITTHEALRILNKLIEIMYLTAQIYQLARKTIEQQ